MMTKNPESRSARISLVFMAAGILLALLPLLAPEELTVWGFASMFIGLLLAVAAFGIFLVLNIRAQARGRMLAGEGVYARWSLDEDVHKKEEMESREDGRNAIVASRILAVFLFLVGLGIFLTDPEGNLLFLGLMAVISMILAVVAGLYSASRVKGLDEEGADVVFFRDGVLWRSEFYHFDGWIRRLESVLVDQGFVVVVFDQRKGRVVFRGRHVLRIPIPRGREAEAVEVAVAYDLRPDAGILAYLNEMKNYKE